MTTNNTPALYKQFMGEAHEAVQARYLGEDFVVRRQTKKGTVNRTIVGVMLSGNKEERAAGVERTLLEMWCENKRHIIVAEIKRVFPTINKEIATRNAFVRQLVLEDASCKAREIDLEYATKQDVMATVGLCNRIKGADKGEKAKLLDALRLINDYELEVLDVANEMARLSVEPTVIEPVTA